MDISKFRQLPLMGIIRGLPRVALKPLVNAVIASGLETIEITMNTPQAPDLIHETKALASGKLSVGAGTVLDKPQLSLALAAGAEFIVSPVFVREVGEDC